MLSNNFSPIEKLEKENADFKSLSIEYFFIYKNNLRILQK